MKATGTGKKVETPENKSTTKQPSLPGFKIKELAESTTKMEKPDLPKIDPKDKGKGILHEEPKKKG